MKHKWGYSIIAACVALLIASGCQGNLPTTPETPLSPTAERHTSQTHLWGLYDVVIDLESGTATATLDRQAMFTCNVVNFLNKKPTNLDIQINSITPTPEYVDVDVNVGLTHPFPGLTQYNGYDVRGVFMGNGSGVMNYNPDLCYPVLGTDQYMLPSPVTGYGGPDGYTRWFNKTEFHGGMPLFSYTQGKYATPGYNPTATLCPYKYFADYLGKTDDLWTWLNDPSNNNPHGVFSAGQKNLRNYYLRFPTPEPNVKFAYAVLANWAGEAPEYHPANAPEAIALSVEDNSHLYYVDPSTKGGSLVLDLSVWDWDSQLSGGVMEDYIIRIESTVLSSVYTLTSSEMVPTGGGEHYSTYHVEIPADNITGNLGQEYWVIVECTNLDYTNEFGIPNDAGTDKLAAFFRYDLYV